MRYFFFFLKPERNILFPCSGLVFSFLSCFGLSAQVLSPTTFYVSKLLLPNDTVRHSNSAVTLASGNDTVFYFSQNLAPYHKVAEFRLFFSQKKTIQELKVPFPKETVPDRLLFVDNATQTIYFKCAVRKDDVYYTKSVAGKWQKPLPFAALNSPFRESGMCVSPDKKKIVFASSRKKEGNSDLDLYVIEYQEDGRWRQPILLSQVLSSDQDEDDPVFSPDGKTLYFVSKGFEGKGNYDLFRSSFDEAAGTWSAPENLGAGVNSEFNEISPAVNSKGELALFCSDRYNKKGDFDLYRPVKEKKAVLSVQVNNEDTTLQLGNLRLVLTPEDALLGDGQREVSSETGIYGDSIFFHRKYTLRILEGEVLLATDQVNLDVNSPTFLSYYIPLSRIKTPYLIYKGKRIPLLTKYTLRYEKGESLPLKNNEKTLDRVAELISHLSVYQVEILYPSSQNKEGREAVSKRVDTLRQYLLKKGAAAQDIQVSKQAAGVVDEVLLKMEFKANVH